MDRSGGGRKRLVVALATALVVGGSPAAGAVSDRVPPGPPSAPFPLPPPVAALAEDQVTQGSNVMFAQIVTAPHKGYDWSIVAYKPRPSARTSLAISFGRTRARGTQLQSSVFTWELPRSALRMDSDLRPASLSTRKGMGSNGAISMKLAKPGRYARFPAGDDCTGEISFRISRFTGRFRFHARDDYFKKISFDDAQVFLYRAHDYRCPDEPSPPVCPQDLSLTGADAESGVAFGAFKTPQGKVDQTVVVARKSGTADSVHTISATVAVPEAFEASDDLTSASLDGDAAGPWLSGDLDYVSPLATDGVDESCGLYRSSSGLATGDYTAHFDSIGPVTPATTGVAATLRREN